MYHDNVVVGAHDRRFGRGEIVYDPWHYVPVAARKHGGARTGSPTLGWLLPANMQNVRKVLPPGQDGDQQMVSILSAVLTAGLAAVDSACGEALASDNCTAAFVINTLARRRQYVPVESIEVPDSLRRYAAPAADCNRYDTLRRKTNGTRRAT